MAKNSSLLNKTLYSRKLKKTKIATNSFFYNKSFIAILRLQAEGIAGLYDSLSPTHSRLSLVETPVVGFTPSAILQRFL